jgi:hypothetical protein
LYPSDINKDRAVAAAGRVHGAAFDSSLAIRQGASLPFRRRSLTTPKHAVTRHRPSGPPRSRAGITGETASGIRFPAALANSTDFPWTSPRPDG